jgi:chromate transporter
VPRVDSGGIIGHAFSPPADPSPDEVRAQPQSLADLFWSFTFLALQGFGGVLAVVQRELVEKKRWMTKEEFVEEWAVGADHARA